MELNANVLIRKFGSGKTRIVNGNIIDHRDERIGAKTIEQDSLARSIFWHLLPGALLLIFYLAMGPIAIQMGYPPEVAALIGTLLILMPVELGHLWLKSGRSLSLKGAIFYTNFAGWKSYLLWVPAMIVWGFLMWGIGNVAGATITQNLLTWLPAWFIGASDFSQYSRGAILATLGLNLLVNGLLAPVVEELYFRGHLLPRIGRFGRLAPVIGATLFTIYHFWQPMIYLPIFLAMLPWIYLVWRKKDVRLGIVIHCGLNLIGALLTFGQILG
jgi:CAAX protease family protein